MTTVSTDIHTVSQLRGRQLHKAVHAGCVPLVGRALQSNVFLIALVFLVILTGWMSDFYR